jgi:hypothetical protein
MWLRYQIYALGLAGINFNALANPTISMNIQQSLTERKSAVMGPGVFKPGSTHLKSPSHKLDPLTGQD